MCECSVREAGGRISRSMIEEIIYARADRMARRVTQAAQDVGRATAARRAQPPSYPEDHHREHGEHRGEMGEKA